mmetsp:Transcript_83534/g.210475  ORF Transcript_83534/g.210475 Transcript_83534/m.210475 type:complete len:103 (-) Transcript_83534:1755-2063(-)
MVMGQVDTSDLLPPPSTVAGCVRLAQIDTTARRCPLILIIHTLVGSTISPSARMHHERTPIYPRHHHLHYRNQLWPKRMTLCAGHCILAAIRQSLLHVHIQY